MPIDRNEYLETAIPEELREFLSQEGNPVVVSLRRRFESAIGEIDENTPLEVVQRHLEIFQLLREVLEPQLSNALWQDKKEEPPPSQRRGHRKNFLDYAQAVVTPIEDRIRFEPWELRMEGGMREALQAILIDPKDFTPGMLGALQLDHRIPRKGAHQEERIRVNSEAVDEVRNQLFEVADPIPDHPGITRSLTASFERIFSKISPDAQKFVVERRLRIFKLLFDARRTQMRNETWIKKREELVGETQEWRREKKKGIREKKKDSLQSPWMKCAPFMKAIQNIFTEYGDRIVFSEEEIDTPEKLKEAIGSIVINPEFFTPNLLKNLGLTQFIPPKHASGIERMELQTAAVEAVREMILHLEPITLSSEEDGERIKGEKEFVRIFRIGAGENEGYLLTTCRIAEQSSRKSLVRHDVYGMTRRTEHIRTGYQEEITKQMGPVAVIIGRIRSALNRDGQVGEAGLEAEKEYLPDMDTIKGRIAEAIKLLKGVRDREKVRLLERLEHAKTLRDILDRFNPGAIATSFTAGVGNVARRRGKISGVSEVIQGPDATIFATLASREDELALAFIERMELPEKRRIFGSRIWLSPKGKAGTLKKMEEERQEIAKISFEPHLTFAKAFLAQSEEFMKALREGSPDGEREVAELLNLYLVAKVHRAQIELMHLYREVSVHGDHLHPLTLDGKLDEIRRHLDVHLVEAQKPTPRFNRIFGEMMKTINYIKRLCEILDRKRELSVTTEQGRIKGHISDIPFDEFFLSFCKDEEGENI